MKVNVNYDISRKVGVLVGGQVLFLVPIKNELYQPNDTELPMMGVEFNIIFGIIYKL